MRTNLIARKVKGLGALAGAAAALLSALFAPTNAEAALVFETSQPTYSVGPTGSPQATVQIFLVQNGGTTTLTSQNGLVSFGLRVTPENPPANPVRLVAIESNPAFNSDFTPDPADPSKDQPSNNNIATGQVFDEVASGSVAASGDRVFLATFTYSGQTAGGQPAATTTFRIGRRTAGSDDTFTRTNQATALDSSIQPGFFTVTVVPEPATSAAVVGLGALGLVARRRRRCPA